MASHEVLYYPGFVDLENGRPQNDIEFIRCLARGDAIVLSKSTLKPRGFRQDRAVVSFVFPARLYIIVKES